MSLLKELRSALETMGYAEIPDVFAKPKSDRWYRHASSTSLIEHVLYLRYLPAGKGYAIDVGVSSPDARKMVKQFLPTYARYVAPFWLAPAGPLERCRSYAGQEYSGMIHNWSQYRAIRKQYERRKAEVERPQ